MPTLVILNFLTALVTAWVLTWKRHPIFAFLAWLFVCLYGYGIYHAGLDVQDTLVSILRNGKCFGLPMALSVINFIFNLTINVAV